MLYSYKAIITKIYDGDTITADIDLGFGIWLKKQSLRLYGIDTPEISGIEREAGLISKAKLEEWIPVNSEVILITHKDSKDKYGRWLAEVYQIGSTVSVNEQLVLGGWAERFMV